MSNQETTKAILILGSDRSGTSMTAKSVDQWIYQVGNSKVDEVNYNSSNPDGFYENQQLEELLVRNFEALRYQKICCWRPSFREGLRSRGNHSKFTKKDKALSKINEEFSRFVSNNNSSGEPWYVKSPYLSVAVPYWEQFIDEPAGDRYS